MARPTLGVSTARKIAGGWNAWKKFESGAHRSKTQNAPFVDGGRVETLVFDGVSSLTPRAEQGSAKKQLGIQQETEKVALNGSQRQIAQAASEGREVSPQPSRAAPRSASACAVSASANCGGQTCCPDPFGRRVADTQRTCEVSVSSRADFRRLCLALVLSFSEIRFRWPPAKSARRQRHFANFRQPWPRIALSRG
jgi:hypothetical protein